MKCCLLLFAALALFPGTVPPVTASNYTEEDLLFSEIPMVVTASRKAQPVSEAPAAVYVVTAEDIRQSGATTVADVLRQVPGLQVETVTARDQSVAIRGFFEKRFSDKLLVMVDGRSLNWDVYGVVMWDLLPVSLSDIERIEIISSPISSLYGANAFSGVINIITRSVKESQGTSVSAVLGERHTAVFSLAHGGRAGALSYKMSADWDQTDEWRGVGVRAGEVYNGSATARYELGPQTFVAVTAGVTDASNKKYFMAELAGTAVAQPRIYYGRVEFNHREWKVCSFTKVENIDIALNRNGLSMPFRDRVEDLDLQHSLSFGGIDQLVWGVSYRYNAVDRNLYISEDHSQNLFGVYADNDLKLPVNLRLSAGARYDWHPLTKSLLSPRASLAWTPVARHTLRVSVANAFRNPTLINSYLNLSVPLYVNIPGGFQDIPVNFVSRGNTDLLPEKITSYEFSYSSFWLEKLTASANLFYRNFSNLYGQVIDTTYYRFGELYPGSPGGVLPRVLTAPFTDNKAAKGYGGELDLHYKCCGWLSATANYGYLKLLNIRNERGLDLGSGENIEQNPLHSAGLGVRANRGAAWINLYGDWVDRSVWEVQDLEGNKYRQALDNYWILNAGLGYTYKNAEFSVGVLNLLDKVHYEYPPGINLPDISSDPVGRKATVRLTLKL